ncbi:MAG: SufE family protein [Proteobacteria bacterium]|nr:SufE family protein [Pseudomonadota bacterium]
MNQVQQEMIESFDLFSDWLEKYQYIIDLGKALPPLDEIHKNDENLLQGCQSKVWLIHQIAEGKLTFQANSDATIVSGLIALVLSVYSGLTAKEILSTKPEFIEKIGLSSHLSSTRSNGLNAMIHKIKLIASNY